MVILTLVRSRPDGNIGFLRLKNRINVLLSRAKHGMYMLGNTDTLRKAAEPPPEGSKRPAAPMWGQVLDMLGESGCIGEAFQVIAKALQLYALVAHLGQLALSIQVFARGYLSVTDNTMLTMHCLRSTPHPDGQRYMRCRPLTRPSCGPRHLRELSTAPMLLAVCSTRHDFCYMNISGLHRPCMTVPFFKLLRELTAPLPLDFTCPAT